VSATATAGERPAQIWHEAATYDAAASAMQRRNAGLLARMLPAAARTGPILEIGCGTGFLTEELVASGAEPAAITALDLSEPMLCEARAKPELAGVRFVCSPFESFEAAGSFRAVASNAAFHWLHPGYEDALKRIAALLEPGGTLLLATAGRTAESDAFDDFVGFHLARVAPPEGPPFRDRRLTPAGMEQLAAAAGLRVDDAFTVSRGTPMPAAHYARWMMASGGPWADEPGRLAVLTERLAEALGGDRRLDVGHWSLFAALTREPAP
jgi:2-polyprenyl-3-methyl-5-hydroxy-6-metoxy-1,4-benzoquinol methylase